MCVVWNTSLLQIIHEIFTLQLCCVYVFIFVSTKRPQLQHWQLKIHFNYMVKWNSIQIISCSLFFPIHHNFFYIYLWLYCTYLLFMSVKFVLYFIIIIIFSFKYIHPIPITRHKSPHFIPSYGLVIPNKRDSFTYYIFLNSKNNKKWLKKWKSRNWNPIDCLCCCIPFSNQKIQPQLKFNQKKIVK